MIHNTSLDKLTDYPFDRLRALLKNIPTPTNKKTMIMSLGEPQHSAPDFLADVISKHSEGWAKYPPIAGTEELLRSIKTWLVNRYDLNPNSLDHQENIIAVSGTREALYMVGNIAISPTETGAQPLALIPNPFYQVYVGAALMNQAQPVYLPVKPENNYLPDFTKLDVDTLNNTALAYLCSPSNPQGSVAPIKYLEDAILLARNHGFVLAIDECYAEIYDKMPPPGGLEACHNLGEGYNNVLVFHSLSKRSNAPGLRSGFVAGDSHLINKFKTLRNYGGASLPGPIQAASAALWKDNNHVSENRALYKQKFDCADQILTGKFDYYRPQGGFYLWLNVGDGEKAARKLWRNAGLRVIPGSYLASKNANENPARNFIRVALVQEPNFIQEALSRLVDTL